MGRVTQDLSKRQKPCRLYRLALDGPSMRQINAAEADWVEPTVTQDADTPTVLASYSGDGV
jgi:hypothetical protein